MKIENRDIFWSLRDKYPECKAIISAIMGYAFTHNDTIEGTFIYLGECVDKDSFSEEKLKLIFNELGIKNIDRMTPPDRHYPRLMVKINS